MAFASKAVTLHLKPLAFLRIRSLLAKSVPTLLFVLRTESHFYPTLTIKICRAQNRSTMSPFGTKLPVIFPGPSPRSYLHKRLNKTYKHKQITLIELWKTMIFWVRL